MAVAVFGIIASLSSKEGTITFIGFLVLIVCLEKGLHFIEHAIEKSGLQLLFNKLKNELMLMGLISFAVLIYDIANSGKSFSSQAVTDAFEMSHVVFFFIATSFVIQAFFLVIYALTLGRWSSILFPPLVSSYSHPLVSSSFSSIAHCIYTLLSTLPPACARQTVSSIITNKQ